MADKVHEVSFEIMGKLQGSFKTSFAAANNVINGLNHNMKELNDQFNSGTIKIEDYQKQYRKLATQMEQTYRAQNKLNDAMRTQNRIGSLIRPAGKMIGGAARGATSLISGPMLAGLGVAGLGIGAGAVIGSSVNKAIQFEQELSSIQAVAGLTNAQLAQMNQLALQQGQATQYSALQAAQGIEELLKAGLTPAQVEAGGLASALNLATAGGLDLADAANIMSNALNGFKKDGMSAADAANILAGAANASSSDVQSLEFGISAVGPVADALGVSFKGVNATLAAFSNNALKGQDAGTSLKTFLQRVQPQTKQAAALFAQYGLTTKNGTNILFKANGELKDMADVAQVLQDKFKNMNDQQRSYAFGQLFGTDAIRAATILYKEGAKGVQDMYNQMSKVTALDVAKQKMNNASGAIEQFKGAIETLQISALMPTLPLIKDLANAAADFVSRDTPAITRAVQNMVNTSSAYLHSHFIDNPAFRNLPTINAKIGFVFNDLMKTFDSWYGSTGSKEIDNITSKLISGMMNFIINDTTQITAIGVEIGSAVGLGILKGVGQSLKDNAKNIGWSIIDPNGLFRGTHNSPKPARYSPFTYGSVAPRPNIPHGFAALHAFGGIFNNPHLGIVAERGTESIIPWQKTAHSASLWKQTGDALGFSSGNQINLTYAPVINGASALEIMPQLEKSQRSFMTQLQSVLHQERRVSFLG